MALSTTDKAIEILKEAVDDDKNKYYEDALHLYVQGVIPLFHAANHDDHSAMFTEQVKLKCVAYMKRAKKLKDHLEKKKIITVNNYLDDLETITDGDMVNVLFETICLYKESSTVNDSENSSSQQ